MYPDNLDEDDKNRHGYEEVNDVDERDGADKDKPPPLPPKRKTGLALTAMTTETIQGDSENHPGSVEGLYSVVNRTEKKKIPKTEEAPKMEGSVANLVLNIERNNMEIAHEIKREEHTLNYWKKRP